MGIAHQDLMRVSSCAIDKDEQSVADHDQHRDAAVEQHREIAEDKAEIVAGGDPAGRQNHPHALRCHVHPEEHELAALLGMGFFIHR